MAPLGHVFESAGSEVTRGRRSDVGGPGRRRSPLLGRERPLYRSSVAFVDSAPTVAHVLANDTSEPLDVRL